MLAASSAQSLPSRRQGPRTVASRRLPAHPSTCFCIRSSSVGPRPEVGRPPTAVSTSCWACASLARRGKAVQGGSQSLASVRTVCQQCRVGRFAEQRKHAGRHHVQGHSLHPGRPRRKNSGLSCCSRDALSVSSPSSQHTCGTWRIGNGAPRLMPLTGPKRRRQPRPTSGAEQEAGMSLITHSMTS